LKYVYREEDKGQDNCEVGCGDANQDRLDYGYTHIVCQYKPCEWKLHINDRQILAEPVDDLSGVRGCEEGERGIDDSVQ